MDLFDRAQAADAFFQKQSLASALSPRYGRVETPLVEDGVRICRDCEEPIPDARLALVPHAVRCARCQERRERIR